MRKPRILISMSNINSEDLGKLIGDTEIVYSDKATAEVICKAGGLPNYLPSIENLSRDDLERYLEDIGGVLLTGADTEVNPAYYNEKRLYLDGRIDNERDRLDIELIRLTIKKGLPILGICKGMQIINVALGGTLYQNVTTQNATHLDHDPKKKSRSDLIHTAYLSTGSLLRKIYKKDLIPINCGHRQAIKNLSGKLRITAESKDGIIEAFESKNKDFILGIQFHAELRAFDEHYFEIFKTFIKSIRNNL